MATDSNISSPFPDILAPKEEKATDAYGLKYAQAIWGTHTINLVQYNDQRQRDIINRQYAEGLQSIEKMKTRKGIATTSYLNLDYSPVNIIATTVDNIVGKLSNIPYKIQCNAIDPESKSRFDDYRKNLYAEMFLKPYSDQLEKASGIPLVAKNKKLPETDEEAELHLKMNYKEEASIAMEEAFNYVFSSNMFEISREEILRDLVTLKRAAILRYYDENWNIKVERVDPVDVVTPFSKYADHRNDQYGAIIMSYTIGQLSVMGDFTDEQLYDMARNQAEKNNNAVWNWGTSYEGYYSSNTFQGTRPYYNFNIQVLQFYFLAIDKEVREIKSVKRKDGILRNYVNKVKEGDAVEGETVSKKIQNLYQGKWVIGTKIIFNYKRAENIPREKIKGSYMPTATLPLKIIAPGIYDMQNKSHVERMIPHEDAINLASLQMQTLLIKMKPPGVAMDIQGLLDAAKGMGYEGKPIEISKIYEQTGNYVYSSINEDGQVINGKVITELRGGLSDAMSQLISVYQFQRNLINEVIGYNTAVDASSPDSNALVGVQRNAIQATNNSLRPLFKGHLNLIESVCKDLGLMIQDCIEEDNESFINAIGTYATKTLEYGKKLAFVQMGIKIELLPDDEEKMEINEQIKLGQMSNPPLLTPSDVGRIRQVMKEDLKLAYQLLVYLEEKNRKNKMDESSALQAQNGQIQQQSAQSAAQAQAQLDQTLTQNKIAVIQAQAQAEDANAQKEFERTMQLQALKNEGLFTVAEISNGGKVSVQKAANDGKIVAAHVASETSIVKEHIIHNSKVVQKHLDHESEIKKGLQEHDNTIEQIEKEAEVAPKPIAKK